MARELFALVGKVTVEGVQTVEKSLAKIDRDARKVTRSFDKLGKRMAAAGSSLTKFVTAPLAIAGGAAIKFGADFESAMVSSLAIMGNVSGEMRKSMETTAREVAKTTKFSAAQAAEAYYFLASAGLDAKQSIEALPQVAAFAQAGLFDLSLATDLLTDAQSALGLSSKDAEENLSNMARVSDVLVKANTLANASVQQFSEALTNKAAAALRMVGKEVEEGVAVLAAFADQGIKGADAGTQLNIVMRDLQSKAVENKKAFKDAGVEVFDAAGEMNNMADIVADLENLLSGMSDEQKRTTLSMLGFTDKSISATSALVGMSDKIREYEENLKAAGGTTKEISDKQLQTFSAQLGLLKDQLIDVGLELWETFQPILMGKVVPALKSGVKWVKDIVKGFSGLSNTTKKIIVLFTAFAAALGPVLLVMGKLFIAVKILLPVFVALKGAVLAFTGVLLTNPVFQMTAAIGLLAFGIAGLVDHYKRAKDAHKEWTIQTADQSAIDGFISSVDALREKLIANSEALKDSSAQEKILGEDMEALKKQAKELGYVIEYDLATNINLFSLLANKLKGSVVGAEKAFSDAMATAKKAATEAKKKTEETIVLNKKEADSDTELVAKKEALEQRWTLAAEKAGKDRIALLEIERREAIKEAEKLGADTFKIHEYYNKKQIELLEERKEKIDGDIEEQKKKTERAQNELLALEQKFEGKKIEFAKMTFEQKVDYISEWLSAANNAIGMLGAAFQQYYQNRELEINNTLQAEIAAVNSSKMSNEAKTKAIQKLEEGADKKLRDLRREQAKREKKLAVFQAIIATAAGVANSLKLMWPLNLVMSAIVGVLGAVQVGLIAAQPIPFAKGGYVKAKPGGIEARIGEGSQDEMVLPMKTGVAELSKQLIDRFKSEQPEKAPKNAGLMGLQPAGGGMAASTNVNFHIGALIADDFGIKELERRMYNVRIAEQQRRGF